MAIREMVYKQILLNRLNGELRMVLRETVYRQILLNRLNAQGIEIGGTQDREIPGGENKGGMNYAAVKKCL